MNIVSLSEEVKKALESGLPVLALESSILAQGMPYPQSLIFAKKAEGLCRDSNVVPATIAIIKGVIHVGLNEGRLDSICKNTYVKKISRRELGIAISKKWTGSTTVSSTLQIAFKVGIKVFATGGIGGVHKNVNETFDISQDIKALSELPLIVITAGPKAILDIEKTMQAIETNGITALGYKVDELPAFYSRNSNVFGLEKVKNIKEIIEIYLRNIELKVPSSILVSNPVPYNYEIPHRDIKEIIKKACKEAENQKIKNKELTPYLLNRIVELTNGKSLNTNIELALNNIALGIRILNKMAKK